MATLAQIAERHRKAREAPVSSGAPQLVTAGEAAARPVRRLRSRIPVIEAATGGGFVCGGTYMLHGEPGSGKSTLLGQACADVIGSVYVTAEEGIEQVGARFLRLGNSRQLIIHQKDTEAALLACAGAPLVVVDSISTMQPDIMTAAQACVDFAQSTGAALVLVCHEIKGGTHAGPRKLEHLIDCTLKLYRQPRVLVVEKNRYGRAPLAWELELGEAGFL